jgi:putative salt-induced outer membrane protein
MRRIIAPSILAACVAIPSAALAQPVPKGATDDATATKGSTDVTSDKAATIDAKALKEGKDASELSISAGAIESTGNAQLFAGTGAGKLRLRRAENQLSAAVALNYARSGAPGVPTETTVDNEQALVRYDRFLGDVALFLQSQARRDRFQGLDVRLNVDPGVGYYFVNEKESLFWVEGGYDFDFDVRREDARTVLGADNNPVLGPDGNPELLSKTQTVHSARVFVGYEQALESGFKLSAGLEYLQAVYATNLPAGTSTTDVYRVNGIAAGTAKILGNLALSLAFTGRYDHAALPGKERLDTMTSASLVYTFL